MSLLLTVEVKVLVACPEAFVVSDEGEMVPDVVATLMDAADAALPPMVRVAVTALVLLPSAAIEFGLAVSERSTVRRVRLAVAVRPL
jgi:hypothetical protein